MCRSKPSDWLAIGVLASVPYLLFFAYSLYGSVAQNFQYNGVFWWADYGAISFLLYLSVPILSLLAARLGSNGSLGDLLLMSAAFFFFVSLGIYSIVSVDSSIHETQVPIDFLDSPRLALSTEAYCNYYNYNLYWFFRRVENGNCECFVITVKRRSPDVHFSPSTRKIIWEFDGAKEEYDAWPMGAAPIISDISAAGDKLRNDWSERKEWNTQVPYKKIVKASHVSFTWGDVTEELSEADRRSFDKIAESYESLK